MPPFPPKDGAKSEATRKARSLPHRARLLQSRLIPLPHHHAARWRPEPRRRRRSLHHQGRITGRTQTLSRLSDIFIVCNARYSRHLVSEHWALLCPGAALGQAANPPLSSNSGLGHFRGSAFTAFLVEQVAREYGVRAPPLQPSAEPKIEPISESSSLPPPPSTHHPLNHPAPSNSVPSSHGTTPQTNPRAG